jgi:orotidine-5'-phosphate decarboxylase
MTFLERLKTAIQTNRTHLCVGLDPSLDRLPQGLPRDARGVETFLREIVEATRDLACVYKPNMAFFGSLGLEGLEVLERVIRFAGERAPVILDAKFGDIGNTAAAYATMAFEGFGADAVTVAPYMGSDSIAPFLEWEDRFAFILGITSNASAGDIEKKRLENGQAVFEHLAEVFEEKFPQFNWGWVAGATQISEMRCLRALSANRWLLIPGVGAQGGGVSEALESSRSPEGNPLAVINASRSILYASEGADFAEAARAEALKIVTEMRDLL